MTTQQQYLQLAAQCALIADQLRADGCTTIRADAAKIMGIAVATYDRLSNLNRLTSIIRDMLYDDIVGYSSIQPLVPMPREAQYVLGRIMQDAYYRHNVKLTRPLIRAIADAWTPCDTDWDAIATRLDPSLIRYNHSQPKPRSPRPQPNRSERQQIGYEMEADIVHMLSLSGITAEMHTSRSGDRGLDILAMLPVGALGYKISAVIQCKQLRARQKTISINAVREAHAAKTIYGAQVAIVVTTARYGRTVRDSASQLGVTLIDGAELEAWRANITG